VRFGRYLSFDYEFIKNKPLQRKKAPIDLLTDRRFFDELK